MGCNCGKSGKANVQPPSQSNASKGAYALTLPSGERSYYATEMAARAANAKAGGKGLVRKNG